MGKNKNILSRLFGRKSRREEASGTWICKQPDGEGGLWYRYKIEDGLEVPDVTEPFMTREKCLASIGGK